MPVLILPGFSILSLISQCGLVTNEVTSLVNGIYLVMPNEGSNKNILCHIVFYIINNTFA